MSYHSVFIAILIVLGSCSFTKDQRTPLRNDTVDLLLEQIEQEPSLGSDTKLFLARRGLSLSQKLDYPRGTARSSHLLGALFHKIDHLDLAVTHLHHAVQVYTELGDEERLAEATSLIGQIYLRTENYTQALLHLRDSYDLYVSLKNKTGKARTQGQIGHVLEKMNQYDSALYYQNQALDYFTMSADSTELAMIYDNIGSIYEDLEVYDEAYKNFAKAYDYNLAMGYHDETIVNMNNIGDTYRKREQYREAIQATRKALNMANVQKNQYQVQSAARDLSLIYKEMRIMDSAYFYLDKSYGLNETIFGQEIARKLGHAQTAFDLEQKQQRITSLEHEKALSQKLVICGATGVVLLLLLTVYGSYQKVAKTSKERKLLEIANELGKSELVNAQLNEEKLRAELENKRLKEAQLQMDLEMKNSALSRSALHLIQKNEFLEGLRIKLKKIKMSEKELVHQKINKLAKSIDLNFNLDDDWEEFENIFQQIHTEFFDKLRAKHPALTNSEVRLCSMIHINLQSHEIASIMNISSDSLRIARYRLRKKLGLEKGENLYNYIVSIG